MSSASNVNNTDPYTLWPEQASPPIPAAGTVDAAAVYCDGTFLQLSVNGSPYLPIVTGAGGTVTLNNAYQGGPAGNTILMTPALGPIVLSSALTTGTIQNIVSTNAPATLTGSLIGLQIDLSSVGTSATPTANIVSGLTVVGPFSSAAKTAKRGLVNIVSGNRNAQSLTIACKNKQALAGSIVSIGWDTTNYEGTGTGNVLTGQTDVVTIDASTNVTPGAQLLQGLIVYTGATTRAWAEAEGSVVFGSGAIGQNVLSLRGSTTSGVHLCISYAVAVAATGGIVGIRNNLQSGIVAGLTNAVYGVHTLMPATSNVGSIGFYCDTIQTAGQMFRGSFTTGTVLAGTTYGLVLDLASGVTASGFAVLGISMALPPSTSVSTRAFEASSAQTQGILIALAATGTLTGSLTGYSIDMSGITHSGQVVTGISITLPATSNTGSSCISMTSSQTGAAAPGVSLTLNGASGQPNGFVCNFGSSLGRSAGTNGTAFYCNMQGTGHGFLCVATSNSAWGSCGLSIQRTAAAANAITDSTSIFECYNNGTYVTGTSTLSQNIGYFGAIATVSSGQIDWSGKVLNVEAALARAGGTLNLTGTLLNVNFAPTGTVGTNTAVGVAINMGVAGATGAALSITHAGTGSNQNHVMFLSAADGTGAHLRGPATATFVIKGGISTGTAPGRTVAISGTAASTSGAGGSVTLTGGPAAGTAAGGVISLNGGAGSGGGLAGYVAVGDVTPTFIELYEMTAPAVAAANGGRLFLVDSGGGKTILKIIFQSGAAQTIATEP